MERSEAEPSVRLGDGAGYRDVIGPLGGQAGVTWADVNRRLVARLVLLKHLLDDERVAQLHRGWECRLELSSGTALPWADAEAVVSAAIDRVDGLREQMHAEASALSVKVGLTWAWVPRELMSLFYVQLVRGLAGNVHEFVYDASPVQPLSRPGAHLLVVADGVPVDQAYRCLRAEFEAFLEMVGTPVELPPGGALDVGKVETITADVEAFYRTKVKDPPDDVRAIARARAKPREPQARMAEVDLERQKVKRGIQRASRLLSGSNL
jgi:hypothetical protein